MIIQNTNTKNTLSAVDSFSAVCTSISSMTTDQGINWEQASEVAPSPLTDSDRHIPTAASAKRRRVRKGTRSCWECKRRKIACTFASAQDLTCIPCQRRRTHCVSQEILEDLALPRSSNRQAELGERIARVEGFIKNFLAPDKRVGAAGQDDRPSVNDSLGPSHSVGLAINTNSAPIFIRDPLTPAMVC
jgi:hypothetical protein